MLKKEHLSIFKICSTEATRYAINGIKIEKGRTLATDGKILMIIEDREPIADFKENSILRQEMAEEICKIMDTGYKIKSVELNANDEKTISFVLVSGDLYSQVTIEGKLIDLNYPDVDIALKSKESPVAEISFSPYLMLKLMKIFNEYGFDYDSVTMKIYGALDAIKFEGKSATGNKMTALLMPVKKG